jgi:hypothetical protein
MEPAREAKALREGFRCILEIRRQLIHEDPMALQRIVHRSIEELLLALEVVVEGTHANVGKLGDLEDRDVRAPFRDQLLPSTNQARTGAGLAPVGARRSGSFR